MTAPFRGIGQRSRNVHVDSRTQKIQGGFSTSRTVWPSDGASSTAVTIPAAPLPMSSPTRDGARIYSMADIDTNIDQLWRMVKALGQQVAELRRQNGYMRETLDEFLPGFTDELDALGRPPEPKSQLSLLPASDPGEFRCDECGDGLEKGPLLAIPQGGYLHESCVLVNPAGDDDTVDARRHV
jgi:hypothetical protein